MWNFYWSRVLEHADKLRAELVALDGGSKWSSQAYTTLDGESGPLLALLTPTLLMHCEETKHYFYKYPSACSLVLQPNDLMRMHQLIHKELTKLKNMKEEAAMCITNYFVNFGAAKLWTDVQRPAKSAVLHFAQLLGAWRVASPKATLPDVLSVGWVKAGQGAKELDFQAMGTVTMNTHTHTHIHIHVGEGFTFVPQLQDAACMSAWKAMAESLAHKHWVNAGLTEEEGDEAEPKQEGWCTQSKYEITTRAEGNKLPRDKRTLNQRRSAILTTPNAVEARAKEARDATLLSTVQ